MSFLRDPRDSISTTFATVRIRFIPSTPVGSHISAFRRYQSFKETVPKSSFGKLVRRPTLLQAYKTMSDQKTVPKGLRSQEVERGNFKPPPVPYIPGEDEVGEKVKSNNRTFKVKIDDKTTVSGQVGILNSSLSTSSALRATSSAASSSVSGRLSRLKLTNTTMI